MRHRLVVYAVLLLAAVSLLLHKTQIHSPPVAPLIYATGSTPVSGSRKSIRVSTIPRISILTSRPMTSPS